MSREPESRASGAGKLWLRRLGWLVLLWSASVAAVALVALLMRALMSAAGLRTS